ncbi:hypothetical protein D3C85_1521700 [compost metagenome]
MGQQEFERQLRPTLDPDLCRPTGQWVALKPINQAATPKRAIANHRHASVAAQRQDAFFDATVIQRIVDLQEVQRLGLEHRFHFFIGRSGVMRDADITDAPRFLPVAQRRQMDLPVQQVMDLHEVDTVGLQ